MKYIDAERLRKEVKGLERAAHKSALGCADSETRKFHEGKDFAYQHVGILIGSLQQEQPEVDLGKEIDRMSKRYPEVSFAKLSRIAVHFAKWKEAQDQKIIELAEDHAYLAGAVNEREKMMKDAVPFYEILEAVPPGPERENVRVIIVKED